MDPMMAFKAEYDLEGNGDEEGDNTEAFDAFNDDTFGDAAAAWNEDDHEELAKVVEEEIHGDTAGNDFFELDNADGDDGDCLEPPGTSTINGERAMAREMAAMQIRDPAIMNVVPAPPRPDFPMQPPPREFVDPAIMSMGSMPLPPRPHFPPNAGAPLTVEELEREMLAQQHRENQLRLQQQEHQHRLQQQQMFVQQQMMIRAQMQRQHLRQQQMEQMQRQGQQHHGHGFQQRQQQLYDQIHQQQLQQQQQRHHQHQHQQDGYDNYNKGRRNFNNRGRDMQKVYDDKDRETFGDDFVADHQKHQKDQHQLIMPGHVHVQSILRGARHGQQPMHASTGNPALDFQHESRRPHHQHYQEEDEYAGLMNSRERQWIINIQLNQLKDEHDYYYTVYNQKKKALAEGIDLKKGRRFFFGEEDNEEDDDAHGGIMKRDDETVLLLKSESASIDSPRDEYTPTQYENSLGKLQAVTVKAPRKVIDVMGVLNQDGEQLSNAQKDSRNFKKTLLCLERLYNILIDVEDCEKKLAALPTGTSLRSQVEVDGKEGIHNLGQQLVRDDKLRLYIAVRKGKALLIRALRWLNTSQMRIVCSTLFTNYPLAVKKDREDKLLKEFWQAGIRRHVANCSSLALIHYYLTIIISDQGQSKSGSILRNVVTTPLGMSFLLGLIYKLPFVNEVQPKADVGKSRLLMLELGQRLEDECKNEKFSVLVHPLSVEFPSKLFNNQDMETESVRQLQRLVQAGTSQMTHTD